MSCQRIFLEPKQHFLPQVADYLIARFAHANQTRQFDLQNLILVFQSTRAARRLVEILVHKLESQGKVLIPPQIITQGALYKVIYKIEKKYLDTTQRLFAWLEALKQVDLSGLFNNLPESTDLKSWFAIAQEIDKIYLEISAANVSFEDVAQKLEQLSFLQEQERWQILVEVFTNYSQILESQEAVDLYQVVPQQKNQLSQEIILVGLSQLNLALKDLISEYQVTSLVFAENQLAEYFDPYGCLDINKWANYKLKINSEILEFVDDAQAQAQACFKQIASWSQKNSLAINDLTIGILDDQLEPYILNIFKNKNVATHSAAGQSLTNTRAMSLLRLIAQYLKTSSWVDFESLVRHPDLLNYLQKSLPEENILNLLDFYQSYYYQAQLSHVLKSAGPRIKSELIEIIYQNLNQLLSVFNRQTHSLSQQLTAVLGILEKVYSKYELLELNAEIELIMQSASQLVQSDLVCNAQQALELLLHHSANAYLGADSPKEGIELLGWLELVHDDVNYLVLTAFNEGFVPQSLNNDPFLPNALRSNLGLVDNQQRFVRDLYNLYCLLKSKKQVKIIASQQDTQDQALLASRLLFLEDNIADRVAEFYQQNKKTDNRSHDQSLEAQKKQFFETPRPELIESGINKVSVTGFKTYLNCPYTFYLQHVLRLESITDQALELDAANFGIILHTILAEFGKSEFKNSQESKIIKDYLLKQLDQYFEKRFSNTALTSVYLQKQQIAQRLDQFSLLQAEHCAQGWQIEHVEFALDQSNSNLDLAELGKLQVTGRIDRIDRHQQTGQIMIIDYKSSDNAKTPRKAHMDKSGWVDLQLPIYKYFTNFKAPEVLLAYINLDAESDQPQLADWTEAELDQAYALIIEVAKKIKSQIFWPANLERKISFQNQYQAILSGAKIN